MSDRSCPLLGRIAAVVDRVPSLTNFQTWDVELTSVLVFRLPGAFSCPQTEPPRKRARRALKYGKVVASKGEHLWTVQWDDGTSTDERSAQLKWEPLSAAMPPTLPPQPPPRNTPDPVRSVPIGSNCPSGAGSGSSALARTPCLTSATCPMDADTRTTSPTDVLNSNSDVSTAPSDPLQSISAASTGPSGSSGMSDPTVRSADSSDLDPSELDGIEDDEDECVGTHQGNGVEVLPPDVHAERWAAFKADAAARIGNSVPMTTNGKTVIWTVVENVSEDTTSERQDPHFLNPGLKGGLPMRDHDIDLAALYLTLRPGDMEADLRAINAEGLRKNLRFKPVTPHELLLWEGLLIGASQYHL